MDVGAGLVPARNYKMIMAKTGSHKGCPYNIFMTTLIEFLKSDYTIHLLILVGIYLILAQGFNLTFGLGRLLNLAHIAVFAVGAYATALLSTELSQGFFICIASSIALSALFALLIGGISLHLSNDYFAVGTLAFSSVVSALLVNWKSLTHGVLGITGIPRPELFGIDFNQNYNFLLLLLVINIVVAVFLYLIFRSGFARYVRAQAEDEYASMSLGINLKNIRNDSFIISSALAGLAGGMFSYYMQYIDPSSFSLAEMVFVLSIVIIGRPGSFWGVMASTFFLVLLPEPLRQLDIPPSILGPMRQMLHSLILFAVVYWNRERMFPKQRMV